MSGVTCHLLPDPELSAFTQMAHWIEEHHFQIDGSFREIVLNMTQPEDFGNAVFEFQIPIAKVNHERRSL
ncbi:MAG: hypothetical protein AAF490_13685 [Chloroflexota bacterium]